MVATSWGVQAEARASSSSAGAQKPPHPAPRDLSDAGQGILGEMRAPVGVARGQRRPHDGAQQDAGVDGRVLGATVVELGRDERGDVLFAEIPKVETPEARDQALAELSVTPGGRPADRLPVW